MPQFSNINVICSDDPQLKKEAVEERLAYGRQLMPNAEFLLFTPSDFQSVGAGAKLKQLESEMSDPGLFGGERIIKINLNGLESMAIEVFKTIAANFRDMLFIVIEMPMIKSTYAKVKPVNPAPLRRFLSFMPGTEGGNAIAAQKDKKHKASRKTARGKDAQINEALGYLKWLNADIVLLYPPEGPQLKTWIVQRAQKYGLGLEPAAVELIANCADNNLLLIDQSLHVMSLTYPKSRLSVDIVDTYFAQDARYTGFELPLNLMLGDSLKALNILNSFYSGLPSELQNGLLRLIRNTDEAIKNLYEAKKMKVERMSYEDQRTFFIAHNVRLRNMQDAYRKALREWNFEMMRQATLCLSEASCALSCFDNEGAYRAMQRLALVPKIHGYNNLKYLSQEPKLF